MQEILFIAFQFPPINVAGAFRPYMFAKYLPANGIKPIVIALDPTSEHEYKVDQNSQHLNELPPEVEVHTVPIEPKKHSLTEKFINIYLSIGDDKYKRWKTNALKKVDEIMKSHQIKAVFVTAPPFSIGNLAVDVSKKYNLPLIFDMRDTWSQWCIAPYATKRHYLLTKKREAYFFENSNTVIANTNVMKDMFLNTHPYIGEEKYQVIHNGFDILKEDIPTVLDAHITSEEIKIGYIGTFYYNPGTEKSLESSWWKRKPHRWFQYFPINERWIYRSPYFFFKTLRNLIDKYPNLKLKFVLIGNTEPWFHTMVSKFNLEESIEYRGFIEHNKLVKATEDINYFLVTSAKVDSGKHYAIASKTFDYIKFKKPILAFLCDGAQKALIKKSNSGYIFNPDDEVNDNVEKLKQILDSKEKLTTDVDYLAKMTRRTSAKSLAEILHNSIK